MLFKTHLVIAVFFIVLFLSAVNNKWLFVLVVLLSTLLADIDSEHSLVGRYLVFKPIQFLARHRGIFHSLTFLLLVSVFFAMFVPALAFAFFLGYGAHLIADSFTKEGIRPFYPLKARYSGWVTSGGRSEVIIFVVFIIVDLFLVAARVFV
jgi:membrane-bound metal-dependent hydrolase YbcI (DUF457 family)